MACSRVLTLRIYRLVAQAATHPQVAPITETADPDMLTRSAIAIRLYGYIQFISFESVGTLRSLH